MTSRKYVSIILGKSEFMVRFFFVKGADFVHFSNCPSLV